MGIIRGTARVIVGSRRLSNTLNPRAGTGRDFNRLGGVDRIYAEKDSSPRLDFWSLLARLGAVIILIVATAIMLAWDSPLATTFSLVPFTAMLFVITRTTARQHRERTSGSLRHYWHRLGSLGPVRALAAVAVASVVLQLLGNGLPESFGGHFFSELADWGLRAMLLGGPTVALYEGFVFARTNRRRDALMHEWGNFQDGYFKVMFGRGVNSPAMHKALHFEGDSVRLSPVPPDIAPKFIDIEILMAKAYIDRWMLHPDSTATDLRWVPITDEWLDRRIILRNSDYTLTGFDAREVEDAEILGMSVPIPPAPKGASKPPKPHRAFVAEHVTEAHLPQIQRFAEENGKTVVGYDLRAFNAEAGHYENVVYVQDVTPIELELITLIASRLGAKGPWGVWVEINLVENDEVDRERYPVRLERVLLKQSPLKPLTGEEAEKKYRPVIEMLPKGSIGWGIETITGSPVVSLNYGKRPTLPDVFPTAAMLLSALADLETTLREKNWARVPQGVSSRGNTVSLNLKNVPHSLAAGGTNSGKSTALLNDVVNRMARGHKICVFDASAKKAGDLLQLKPYTLLWCTSQIEAANGLAHLYKEVRRRSRYLMETYRVNNWLQTDDFAGLAAAGFHPITVYFDEYETSIDAPKEPKSLDREDPKRVLVVNKLRAIDEIEGTLLKLAREARAVGIFLYVATQKPLSQMLGSALRSQLGNSLQLVGGKMSSTDVALTMGNSTSAAMEQIELFHRPKLDENGKPVLDENGEDQMMPGLGILLADGSEPIAIRVGFSTPEGALNLVRNLGIPEAEPWKLRDLLDLDMANDDDRFEDMHENRTPVDPPFWESAAGISSDDNEITDDELASVAPPAPDEVTKSVKDLFGFDLGE